jgi:hypothetical protein
MRAFPPRLAHQPIFYPVATLEYAVQIARDWNPRDQASGFSGFVTEFAVPDDYLRKFEPRTVGSSLHVEYWVPAAEVATFNSFIESGIAVQQGYFGEDFAGYIPEKFGLRGKDAVQQFLILARTWGYSRMDFTCEVSANRKTVYLNCLFWAQFDFTSHGVTRSQKDLTVRKVIEAWNFNRIEIQLPLQNLTESLSGEDGTTRE